jgi:hypothetical protein
MSHFTASLPSETPFAIAFGDIRGDQNCLWTIAREATGDTGAVRPVTLVRNENWGAGPAVDVRGHIGEAVGLMVVVVFDSASRCKSERGCDLFSDGHKERSARTDFNGLPAQKVIRQPPISRCLFRLANGPPVGQCSLL